MVEQLVNNIVHGVQNNIARYCLNNAEQHDQFLPVYIMGIYITQQKTPSPLLNRIEQCFAAHVDTCQQY
jgi:hypothetical protein